MTTPPDSTTAVAQVAQASEIVPLDNYTVARAGSVKEALLETVIESYQEGYKHRIEAWRNLDTKAQGSIAIAGIFIAGVFAFIQKIDTNAYPLNKEVLALALLFLMLSVGLAMKVLALQTLDGPPLGGFVDQLVENLQLFSKDDSDFLSRISSLSYDQVLAWRNAEKQLDDVTHQKAQNLWAAQIFLMLAIFTVALMTMLQIHF